MSDSSIEKIFTDMVSFGEVLWVFKNHKSIECSTVSSLWFQISAKKIVLQINLSKNKSHYIQLLMSVCIAQGTGLWCKIHISQDKP